MEELDTNFRKLEHINGWISNCDSKSSFVFTFFGVMITILFTSSIGHDMINVFKFRFAIYFSLQTLANFICLLSVIVFIGSSIMTTVYLYNTLRGRLNIHIYQDVDLKKDSNIFCGTIADKSFNDFLIDSSKADELLKDINSQVYINAHIAKKKFEHYNMSLKWLVATFTSFIIFVIFQTLAS